MSHYVPQGQYIYRYQHLNIICPGRDNIFLPQRRRIFRTCGTITSKPIMFLKRFRAWRHGFHITTSWIIEPEIPHCAVLHSERFGCCSFSEGGKRGIPFDNHYTEIIKSLKENFVIPGASEESTPIPGNLFQQFLSLTVISYESLCPAGTVYL